MCNVCLFCYQVMSFVECFVVFVGIGECFDIVDMIVVVVRGLVECLLLEGE